MERSREIEKLILFAEEECHRLGHHYLGVEHMFIAMTKAGGVTEDLLRDLNLEPRAVRDAIRRTIGTGDEAPQQRDIIHTPRTNKLLALAAAQAAPGSAAGEPELLHAMLREGQSTPIRVLAKLGITPEALLERLHAHQPAPDEAPLHGDAQRPQQSALILRYGRDLTELARQGKLHDVIGRKEELRQIVRILLRATKNNPLLIGDAGVGKTVLVEGLAVRIAAGRVVDELSRKQLVELDLAQLIAGTKYRGEFEQHLTDIINAARHDPDLILFIDEIHTIIGAGRAEGGLDAANIMKPALTSGALRCIGATTVDEYHRYIEKDAALERRFQPVVIKEPTLNEAFEILLGLRPKFEEHHNVVIEPEALRTAVDLSERFLPDRRLPDKAIDLMDEACAHLRIQTISPGPAALCAPPMVLDQEHIAAVLTQWTGLPVSELTQAARERFAQMPELLARRVVGQDGAVAAVSRVVSASSIGLKFRKRPIGVFLFIGPTGVGKTELAKALAEFLFGSDEEIIRLDMSEYMQEHEAAKLIGAPPGYVGYDEGGQLTDQLRRKPYSVVLLDEVEKANARVFDMFLQLFDDGRLTDARGRTVDATSAVFIMTSNIGSALYSGGQSIGFNTTGETDVKHGEVIRECKKFFRPEFLNRIDEIIVFDKLGKNTLRRIVDRLADDFGRQLADRHIELALDDSAIDRLCEQGYEPAYGARPLRRAFDREIAQPVGKMIIEGKVTGHNRIRVIAHREAFSFLVEETRPCA